MNIQTAANRLNRKITKAQAQSIIENLYNGVAADPKDLAALYKYFMPAIPKKANPVAWVAKARSKEQSRYYITQSYCDGTYLVATDGHRLHCTLCDKPAGYYDHDGNVIDMEGTFPKWENIMPKVKHSFAFDTAKALLGDYKGKATYELPDLGVAFNKRYVDDALNGLSQCEIWHTGDYRDPIKIILPHGTAVIMPIRK